MRLERWSIAYPEDSKNCRIQGYVYGSDVFEDGSHIITSRIKSFDGVGITTQSGSFYELGEALLE